ncbi:MAG TPA: lytic murein transglycosylase [Trebonia sp.]
MSSRRVIGVQPQTAAALRPGTGKPKGVAHLFSDPSRTSRHSRTEPVRVNPGCHTSPGDHAVAYAAGAPRPTVRIVCPTPTPTGKPVHQPATPAAPTFPTGTPATHSPAAGHSPAAPARHSHAGRGARRGSAGSHATGGAPLTAPVTGSAPAPGTSPEGSVPTLSPSPPGFQGPKSWTGTVSADPALTGAVNNLSGLLSNGNRPPSFLIPIYMQAAARYHLPWEVLAAINAIESDYGRNLNTSTAGALGWMQFEPSTWKQYGMAVDGHSVPNPYDPRDAIFSAARYLAAAGGRDDISGAVFAYNHAGWYVDEVMARAQAIASHAQYERTAVKRGTFSVSFATGVKRRPTISYQSSVLSHYDRLIAAANMVSAANFPYLYGGGHEQPAIFAPFDCSGSVSYVMQQAGYTVPTTVSGDIPTWKFPAGPGQVTIFYNPVHTFMRIGNRYFGTSGFARPGGGAGWFDVNQLPAGYLATFREVHVPGLGTNSFAPGQVTIPPPPAPKRHSTTVGLKLTLLMSSLGPFPRA